MMLKTLFVLLTLWFALVSVKISSAQYTFPDDCNRNFIPDVPDDAAHELRLDVK